jgi:HlyD family secretion protein
MTPFLESNIPQHHGNFRVVTRYHGAIVKRWIPRLVLLAILTGAGVAVAMWKPWAKSDAEITFATVTAGKGTIAAQVTANGTLSAHKTVTVGAQVSGRIVELDADFNSVVKEKQTIAKLDDVILKAQVDQARANLDQAIANLEKARVGEMDGLRQYKRQQVLRDQSLVADLTVETAEVTYKQAVANTLSMAAQVEQNRAQLDQAKLNLSYATIYSPVNGIVLSRAVDVGQTVAASLSAPTLFTIAEDLSRMQIDTSVAESDVGRLDDQGVTVTFTVDAFPGKVFKGSIQQIRNSPTTTQGVVTYDAVIDVDNSDLKLRPGMTANVTFVLAQVQDAIKIPNAALRFKPTRDQVMAIREAFGGKHGGSGHHDPGGGAGSGGPSAGGMKMGADGRPDFGDKKPVWKLVDGRPKMVLIKPGLTDGSMTQLIEGEIEPGDTLITDVQGLPTSQPGRKVGAF